MKKIVFWIVAVFITLASAVYQRITGPTYPLRGKAALGETEVKYKLPRSAENKTDCEVGISIPDPNITGYLEYKRFKTEDPWTRLPLAREEEKLAASLPKQPAAGKLAYKIVLVRENKEVSLSGDSPVITRFKNHVPEAILIPHILVMFLAMLFSTRAGLEALDRKSNPRKLVLWTIVLLFIGGFILGPLVQKFSFGPWWTGFPIGFDLTDNKTLIGFAAWVAAAIAGRKGKPARGWVFAAAVLMLVIYLIPHSLLGSELDYSKMGR